MLWVCGTVYLLVMASLAVALWRHRHVLEFNEPQPEPVDRGLKVGLVGWILVMTVGLTVLAAASFLADRRFAARQASDALAVRVTGHQWWWRIQYRDPVGGGWIETANELHLPQGRTANIELNAADVIHSFWIPNLSGKIDMIPGRTNRLVLTPRRTGWFRGQCAEFCGLQHAQMALDVKVESPADFAGWLAAQGRPATTTSDAAARGRQILTTGPCGQCHSVRGTDARGRAAPDLTHVGSRRSLAAGALPQTRGALMGWIAQPQALKPGAEMPPSGLSPADTLAVALYLEGLK
jgi:cytochrome c oxidase subunit 2